MFFWFYLANLLVYSLCVSAGHFRSDRRHTPPTARDDATMYNFDQLIDHGNASLGTFQQRYYCNAATYSPGGPIILMIGGENDIDGQYANLQLLLKVIKMCIGLSFLTDSDYSLVGAIAKEYGGLILLLENRFFGTSVPFGNLNETSLRFHTLSQSVEDLAYFAQNVALPIANGSQESLDPNSTLWILAGVSFAGE